MAFNITARDKSISPIATASQRVIGPGKVSSMKISFIKIDAKMFSLTTSIILSLNLIRYDIFERSSYIKAMSAVSKEISLPMAPIAVPTLAAASAGGIINSIATFP